MTQAARTAAETAETEPHQELGSAASPRLDLSTAAVAYRTAQAALEQAEAVAAYREATTPPGGLGVICGDSQGRVAAARKAMYEALDREVQEADPAATCWHCGGRLGFCRTYCPERAKVQEADRG